ncbi:MAG: glycerol-3-phosphate acyltransferase, partial [Acidimicrobiales bacterium]
ARPVRGGSLARPVRGRPLAGPAVLAVAYITGSLPFSNLVAGCTRGVDLREVGSGTVSGTGLYQVAGFVPLAIAGSLDLAKGAIGTVLAGSSRRSLRSAAAGMVVAGHNWSPFLSGAGGRGLAPALGATLALAPEATAVLGIGLGGGRLIRRTGAGCFWATLALFPVLAATRGRPGVLDAGAIVVPLLAKRLLGNELPLEPSLGVFLNRLVLDRDEPALIPT